MAIKISKHEDLTVHDVTGSASEMQMYDAIEKFYQEEPTALLLWDMSQADVSHVTPDILRNFAKKSAILGVNRQGGRTAVVAPKDLQYGLARMSEVFLEAESAPFSFRVFRTRDEALQWLRAADSI